MLRRSRKRLRARPCGSWLATALLAEFGIIAPQGIHRVEKLAVEVNSSSAPPLARQALTLPIEELADVWPRVEAIEVRLITLHRATR